MNQAVVLRELKVNLGLPWKKLSQIVSLTKRRVLDLVGFLDFSDEIKEDIRFKKLTEKHGRTLRQLLDQAEVLREVFNFLKEKKLTGDQSLELVRRIKSELGFTTEESYNGIKSLTSKKAKPKKELSELLIDDCDKLIKSIDKFNSETIDKKNKKALFDRLNKLKDSIDLLLNREFFK